ncbi:MAG: hypothetical protein ABSE82_08425 [Nitrososphaerales archaeon]|jgi:hypothetical protein
MVSCKLIAAIITILMGFQNWKWSVRNLDRARRLEMYEGQRQLRWFVPRETGLRKKTVAQYYTILLFEIGAVLVFLGVWILFNFAF